MILAKYKQWIFGGIGVIMGVIVTLLLISIFPGSKEETGTLSNNYESPPPSSSLLNENTSLVIPLDQEIEPLDSKQQETALLGDQYFENRQFDQAINLYKEAIEKNPEDVDTYNDLGLSYFYTQKPVLAIETLRKGTKVNPLYQRIWLSLGFVLSSTGNLQEAKPALRTAVDLDPNNDVGKEAIRMLQQIQ